MTRWGRAAWVVRVATVAAAIMVVVVAIVVVVPWAAATAAATAAAMAGVPECMCAFASHQDRKCGSPLNHQQCRSKRTHSSLPLHGIHRPLAGTYCLRGPRMKNDTPRPARPKSRQQGWLNQPCHQHHVARK